MTPESSAQTKLGLIILASEKFEKLKNFYLTVFGADITVDVPVYCEMQFGPIRLGIYDACAYLSNLGSAQCVGFNDPSILNPVELYFCPANIANTEVAILEHGGQCLAPIECKPWGDAVAYYRDPDGNVIALASPNEDFKVG